MPKRTTKNKEHRKVSADERLKLAEKRTPEEQLARLDTRICAAKKERVRLGKIIKAASNE